MHETNPHDAAYRGVVKYCENVTMQTAVGADLVTKGALDGIFKDMVAVFDIIDGARSEIAALKMNNPDLNQEALVRKATGIASRAAIDARAAKDRAAAATDRLVSQLEAATRPKLPPDQDRAAQQMELLNLKKDLKMLLDVVYPDAVAGVMLKELADRVRVGDQLGMYLLGADRWPLLYLRSRGQDSAAFNYPRDAAAHLKPTVAANVRIVSDVLDQINAPGKNGIRAVLANVDMYLSQNIPDLEKMPSQLTP